MWLLFVFLLALACGAPDAPAQWQGAVALSVQEGDFGTTTTSTTTTVSATLRRRFRRGDAGVTASHLRVENEAADGSTTSASGAGDLWLGGRYHLLFAPRDAVTLSAVGRAKLPLADEGEGLGTGEADVVAGLELSRFVSDAAFVFADADYTLTGDPPGAPLNDQWRVAAGGGSYFGRRLVASASVEERRALRPGEEDPREALVALSYLGDPGLQAAAIFGLSDGAPDYGLTGAVFWTF